MARIITEFRAGLYSGLRAMLSPVETLARVTEAIRGVIWPPAK